MAALSLLAASVAAQAPPNFSGRWILAPEPPATGQRGGSGAVSAVGTGWGSDITITQDAATLTVEFNRFARGDMQPPTKLVYLLNGTEGSNTVNLGRGPQEQRSKTAWDGTKLVITTVHTFTVASPDGGRSGKTSAGGRTPMTSETRHVLALESSGVLAIETTHSGVLGGPSSTTKALYKKN